MAIQEDIKVLFFFQKTVRLNERKRLKKFLNEVLKKKGKKLSGEIRIIFCSDEELLQVNRQFLKHDFYTDIVTFPLTSPEDKKIEAELYISVDRVRENAGQIGASLERELHRVIFHGILHLCGLNDKSRMEKQKMRETEDSLLFDYFQCST